MQRQVALTQAKADVQAIRTTEDVASLRGEVSDLVVQLEAQVNNAGNLAVMQDLLHDHIERMDPNSFHTINRAVEMRANEYRKLFEDPASDPVKRQNAHDQYKTVVKAFGTKVEKLDMAVTTIQGVATVLSMSKSKSLQTVGAVLPGAVNVGLGIAAALGSGVAKVALMKLGFAGAFAPPLAIAAGIGMIASALSSSKKSDNSAALAQISKQLVSLSKQVSQLGEQVYNLGKRMDSRFDRVEQLLFDQNRAGHNANMDVHRVLVLYFEEVVGLMDALHQTIITQFIQTQGQVDSLEALTRVINTKIDRLSKFVNSGFRELFRQQFDRTVQVVEYYDNQVYGQV